MFGLLKKAKLSVFEYDHLLTKGQSVPDDVVLDAATKAGFVLITKDSSMEDDWIQAIIEKRARVIRVREPEEEDGANVTRVAAAIICSNQACHKILLENLNGPLVIRVNSTGEITKVLREQELRAHSNRLLTGRIVRGKRHYSVGVQKQQKGVH